MRPPVLSAILLLVGCAASDDTLGPGGGTSYDTPDAGAETPSIEVVTSVCRASSAATLATCVNQLRAGTIDNIEVTTLIACSGAGACVMDLRGITRPFRIFGTAGVSATSLGFRRLDHYDQPILAITSSTGTPASPITIRNLSFIEVAANVEGTALVPVGSGYTHLNQLCSSYANGHCSSPIGIAHSSNVLLDGIIVQSGKDHGITVTGTTNFKLQNSRVRGSYYFGLWGGPGNRQLSIIHNYFVRNRSNGILWGMDDPALQALYLIRNNTFENNHYDAAFYNPSRLPYTGGQIDMLGTGKLLIENNEFKTGRMDDLPTKVGGIEIHLTNPNATIYHNRIHDNIGGAVYSCQSAAGVKILTNEIYSNGRALCGTTNNQVTAPNATILYNCGSYNCQGIVIPPPPFPI
jgi:hypothetical protein